MVASFLYAIAIRLYGLLIGLAAPFNPKARAWRSGRRQAQRELKAFATREKAKTVWIHAASLGEFEQGRAIIEQVRLLYPNWRIVLSFFSPSGYEIRKNYDKADLVTYMPLDTAANAKLFLDQVRPDLAIFIKYEIWPNHLFELKARNIPAVLISGRFYKGQVFFKPWGGLMRRAVGSFRHLFLQDQNSADLISSVTTVPVTLAGDTRFDRVLALTKSEPGLDALEAFKGEHRLLIAGSSWPKEEAMLTAYLQHAPDDIKLLIAPHEVDEANVTRIEQSFDFKVTRWSKLEGGASGARVLIMDTIGLLSKAYAYADLSFIGGGFGAGVHNVLEAAVWGSPIIIGPKHSGVVEVEELKALEVCKVVRNQTELDALLAVLWADGEGLKALKKKAIDYCESSSGASKIILDALSPYLDEV